MKFSTIIVLLILIISMLCPSQITIKHTDDDPRLINLDVCNVHPALSIDSNTPVLIVRYTLNIISPRSDVIFDDNTVSYKFLSVKEILRPPIA